MDDELDLASLTEIRIEPTGPVLRVGYSIPDQGGTQLLYEFALPPDASQDAILATGYAHESHRDSDFVALQDLPRRLVRDVRTWLADQLPQAEQRGKHELVAALQAFREALSRAAAQQGAAADTAMRRPSDLW